MKLGVDLLIRNGKAKERVADAETQRSNGANRTSAAPDGSSDECQRHLALGNNRSCQFVVQRGQLPFVGPRQCQRMAVSDSGVA
jgi:hypothetical protein